MHIHLYYIYCIIIYDIVDGTLCIEMCILQL